MTAATATAAAPLRFGRDLMRYVPAKVVPAIVAFLVVILLTHRLTPADYGRYAWVLSVTTLTDAFVSTWLRQSTLRYYAEYQIRGAGREFQELLYAPVVTQTLAIALGVAIVLLVTGRSLLDAELVFAVLLTLLPFSYVTTVLQASRQAGGYAVVTLVQSLVQAAWVVLFVNFRRGGFEAAVGAVVAGYVAAFAVVVVRSRAAGIALRPVWRGLDGALVRQLLVYGLPMSAWLFCFQLLSLGARLVIETARSPGELGPYASTFDLLNGSISLLMTPFLLAAHPMVMHLWAAGRDRGAIEDLLGRVTRYLLLLVVPVCIILAALNEELLGLVLGRGFRLEGWVVQVVVAGAFVGGLANYAHKGLEIAERTGVMLAVVAATALLNLALNLVLIPRYGVPAAAVVTCGSYLLYAVAVYLFSRSYARLRVSPATLLRVGAAGLGGWLALRLAAGSVAAGLAPGPRVAAEAAFAGAVYVAVLLATGELAMELRRLRAAVRSAATRSAP